MRPTLRHDILQTHKNIRMLDFPLNRKTSLFSFQSTMTLENFQSTPPYGVMYVQLLAEQISAPKTIHLV